MGPYVSPTPFAHINNMIEDMGPTKVVEFLLSMQNGEVLRKAKAKYGVYVVDKKGESGVKAARSGSRCRA